MKPLARLGWSRAAVIAIIVSAVSIALVVYVPNIVLMRWQSLSRPARVAVATGWFFGSLLALAATMRRLQKKGIL